MKKLLVTLALVLGTITVAHAQIGIIGGWTTAKTLSSISDLQPRNGNMFHAGVAYKIELGPVFTLQPALVYHGKTTFVNDAQAASSLYTRGNFLELEVGAQVGIDLLALRPYFLFEPFVGYDLGSINWFNGAQNTSLSDARNKFEYGFGVGGGIELLNHIQISVQWFMNIGNLYDAKKLAAEYANYANLRNFQGVKVSLGLFF